MDTSSKISWQLSNQEHQPAWFYRDDSTTWNGLGVFYGVLFAVYIMEYDSIHYLLVIHSNLKKHRTRSHPIRTNGALNRFSNTRDRTWSLARCPRGFPPRLRPLPWSKIWQLKLLIVCIYIYMYMYMYMYVYILIYYVYISIYTYIYIIMNN